MATLFAGTWGPEPIISTGGAAVPGAIMTLYEADGTSLATVYSDRDRTSTISNPMPTGVAVGSAGTDVLGNARFCAEPNDYVLAITVGPTEVYRSRIVLAKDPDEPGGGGTVTPSGAVWPYRAKTTATSGYPGDGYMLWDNATQISATHLLLSHLDYDGDDIDLLLALLIPGLTLIVQDRDTSQNYQKWTISGTPVNTNPGTSTSYWTVPVTLVASAGTGTTGLPNNHQLLVITSALTGLYLPLTGGTVVGNTTISSTDSQSDISIFPETVGASHYDVATDVSSSFTAQDNRAQLHVDQGGGAQVGEVVATKLGVTLTSTQAVAHAAVEVDGSGGFGQGVVNRVTDVADGTIAQVRTTTSGVTATVAAADASTASFVAELITAYLLAANSDSSSTGMVQASPGSVAITATGVGSIIQMVAGSATLNGSDLLTALTGQPLNANLTAIAALAGQTSYGRSFLTLADAAAARTYLALGTAATQPTSAFDAAGAAAAAQAASQPLDADLTAIAALAGQTSYGRSFLTLADAAAARTYLALGTAATQASSAFDAAGAAAAAQAASQPLDADLTAIAALATTAYGRAFLTLANQAALMALLLASSTTDVGVTRYATNAETIAGTSTTTAVTPAGLAAAVVPIGSLPHATVPLVGDELAPLSQGGVEKYATIAEWRALDVQVFTSGSGNWTKPGFGTVARIICIGGGGGGGSARKGAAGSVRCGGGGGAGGGYQEINIALAALASTVPYSVGAGGAGGTSISAADTNGNNGSDGGASNFGTSGTVLSAVGGTHGNGGTAAAGAGGVNLFANGAAGASASTTGLVGNNGTGTTVNTLVGFVATGGGSGGGITTGNAASNGGTGGINILRGDFAGAAGTGAPGASNASSYLPGAGGGGGPSSTSTNGTTGGAGGTYGGGGGGGGAAVNAVGNSGAGGAGGDGAIIVIVR